MDADDSFTRELEESSLMPVDGHVDDQDMLDLDLDLDNPQVKLEESAEQPQQSNNRFVSSVADDEAREANLRAELESVRRVNKLILAVNKSLQDAMRNMGTVNSAVDNANFLLDKYTQILSQSTHTSRIILNGHWQGSTNDIAEMENEAQNQALEAERRREEEEAAAAAREREARAREAAAAAQAAAGKNPSGRRGMGTGRKTPSSRSASASGAYSSGYGKPSAPPTRGSASSSGTSSSSRGLSRGSGLARYAGRGAPGVGRGGTIGGSGRGGRGA
ncbi:hypothetical protein H072_7489 [Dactylellina haptotyla CBS 200.50]|uniref:DASH complex subunit DUO1 n=1 Tax=Dactylellina haptotyla (strain CBS 200.50) TaxID=1284197 RepID=S8A7F8_DACHA|nr:hypothetical protein H072_7489 [Dactylellina haptotyla CBS 200.50]